MSAPLLLLHGFTGSRADWQPFHTLLPRFHTIALDLPGHGHCTMPPPYTMAKTAVYLLKQMETVVNGRPFHLLGYSMGGRLALYIALHYPQQVASLILESASPGLAAETDRHQRHQQDNALADRIERDGLAAFIDFWEQLPLWQSQQQLPAAVRQELRQRRLQNEPRRLANSLRQMGTGVQPSLWPRLAALSMPAQLIVGEHDEKFTAIAQEMAQTLPDVRLDVVAGAGHTVHLERPLRFAEIVGDSLRRKRAIA